MELLKRDIQNSLQPLFLKGLEMPERGLEPPTNALRMHPILAMSLHLTVADMRPG